MVGDSFPTAVLAEDVGLPARSSNYPEPFASRMVGREKRKLGEVFGLSNFGVNLTRLAPAAVSALRHGHSRQEEFIYIVSGRPTLVTDSGDIPLSPGWCAGFKAGTGNAHHLVNRTSEDVTYLEVGDRSPGDSVHYPEDDIQAVLDEAGTWQFTHKDGSLY